MMADQTGGQVETEEEVVAECLEMEKHHSQRQQASTIRLLVIQNLPRWHSLTRVPMVWVEEEEETVQEARKGGQVEAEEVAAECLEMEKHHSQRPQASTIRLLVIQNLPRWHSLTRVPMVWVEEEKETVQEARKGGQVEAEEVATECLEMEKHHSQRPQASTIRLLVIQNLPRWHSLTRVPMVWVEEEKETVQEARKGGQVEAEEVATECLEMEKHHPQRPQASTIRLLVIQNLPRWHSLTRVPMVWVEEEEETAQEARKGRVKAKRLAKEHKVILLGLMPAVAVCSRLLVWRPQRPQE